MTTPDPPHGRPRAQYARVVNVIPTHATDTEAVEIFLRGWRAARQTAGGSYDDAGLGALESKTAVLWNIPPDHRDAYRDFYAHHYPGTAVVFQDTATKPPINPPWRPLSIEPPRPGLYRVKIRLRHTQQDPPLPDLDLITWARWTRSGWLDALPPRGVTAWTNPWEDPA